MKLVVIGGTAAGLSAASKAKRSVPDMDVTVYEASGYVSYGSCGLPYFIGVYIDDPDELISLHVDELRDKRGIETYIHHRVTKIDRETKTVKVKNLDTGEEFTDSYDKLVIATGARAILPDIPGADGKDVYTVRTVEDGINIKAACQGKKNIVIVGGGFIGLELSEQLTLAGYDVSIVEAMPRLLPAFPESYADMLMKELEKNNVQLCLGESASQVCRNEQGDITAVMTNSGRSLPAQMVIFSVGVRPNSELAKDCGLELGFKNAIKVDEYQQTSDKDIWACGDCVEMKNIVTGGPCYIPLGTTANKQGKIAGDNVAGANIAFPGVLGSQVTKVFDLYLSATGLSLEQAKETGFDAVSSSISKADRASYYPGGELNYITLVFERKGGRLLGAQAAGSSTISGRINVLAAAITNGMTVEELNNVDFVYSPSVAPVYDPLLIAASQALKKVE